MQSRNAGALDQNLTIAFAADRPFLILGRSRAKLNSHASLGITRHDQQWRVDSPAGLLRTAILNPTTLFLHLFFGHELRFIAAGRLRIVYPSGGYLDAAAVGNDFDRLCAAHHGLVRLQLIHLDAEKVFFNVETHAIVRLELHLGIDSLVIDESAIG